MSSEVPAEFVDAITMEMMDDPVITCDGQTYDRRSIEEWLRNRNTSPLTGALLASKTLTPNISLKKLIDDYKAQVARNHNVVSASQSSLPEQLVKISGTLESESTKALVYKSYGKQGDTDECILITDVHKIVNHSLLRSFNNFKSSHQGCRILRLFHGTNKQPVEAIAVEGFKLPPGFTRSDSAGETGLLTFGKALYFAFDASKAVEFGSKQVLVCDVALGDELQMTTSHHSLTEEKMLAQKKHSVVAADEVAVYTSAQALPVYAVTYCIVKQDGSMYDPAAAYQGASAATLDVGALMRDLDGRPRCRECALRALGDICREEQPTVVPRLLCDDEWSGILPRLASILSAQDQSQASLWLGLRVLWNAAYKHRSAQMVILRTVGAPRLTGLLEHWSESIRLRAAGVVLNLCHSVVEHREEFWREGAARRLVDALRAAVEQDNGSLQAMALSATANLSFHPHARAWWAREAGLLTALQAVVEPLFDSPDPEVFDCLTRLIA
jgi:hypothetical protein